MAADREALDALLGDMASHQAEVNHALPTPDQNQALAAELLERLDLKASAPPPAPVVVDLPDASRPRASDLEAAKRGFTIKRGDELGKDQEVKLGPATLERYEKVRLRVKLLMSKTESGPLGQPSWAARYGAVLSLGFTGRTEKEIESVRRSFGPKIAAVHLEHGGKKSAVLALKMLIEESNAAFGPWWAETPRRIQVG
jgi:hypothetical protein